ncbi:MAG TPA: glycosyl hydrolase family 18 protein [Herpetosiphonaceae bacterium]
MQRLTTILIVVGLLLGIGFSGAATAAPTPWTPGTFYATGAQVTYQAGTYEAIQGHTAQVGWEPPAVPALWKSVPGTPATATPTIRPTNTATPRPTNTPLPGTPTATPRPTNTATPQPTGTVPPGCPAQPWRSGTVYTNGNIVSHNGRAWRAKWWTQNEEPGVTTSGVWEDVGPCNSTPTSTPTGTPPATPTPRPTNTPSPTNTPGPTATPCPNCGGGLPRRVIVGYWHNFDNGSGVIRLRNVSPKFDVIQVAFAEPTGAAPGVIGFTPYGSSVAEFKADVAYLKSQGKKVLISIGGANGQVQLTDAAARQNFVASMKTIISEYGFDGLDIDFEGHSLYLNEGDRDFRNPTTPVITNLIAALRELRSHFGANFLLTMAPETFFVQLGYTFYGGSCLSCDRRAGAYLPVIHAMRDNLTLLHVQDYNSGPIRALDNVYYSMGNADFHVAMTELVLNGFPVADTGFTFPGLRPEQVAIGLPANVNAGGGFTPVGDVQKALDYLIKGQGFGGSYALRKPGGYPQLRGLMTWSINWDAFNSFEFSTRHRAYLDALP